MSRVFFERSPDMALYTRKETSEKTQIPSDTLRYYENLGVIPAPKRADNSYRY